MENIKRSNKLKTLTLNALMLAVLIVSAQIIIPMPIGVPFTLQTLAVALLAYLLSIRNSLIVLSTYLVTGFLGLPFFSGFSGGPAKLVTPSAGYLFGFIPMVILLSFSKNNWETNKFLSILYGVLGLLSCHLIGILWLSNVVQISLGQAAMVGSVPFLIKDILSVILGASIAKQISKFI